MKRTKIKEFDLLFGLNGDSWEVIVRWLPTVHDVRSISCVSKVLAHYSRERMWITRMIELLAKQKLIRYKIIRGNIHINLLDYKSIRKLLPHGYLLDEKHKVLRIDSTLQMDKKYQQYKIIDFAGYLEQTHIFIAKRSIFQDYTIFCTMDFSYYHRHHIDEIWYGRDWDDNKPIAVARGPYHAAVLFEDGSLKTIGSANYGGLGNGKSSLHWFAHSLIEPLGLEQHKITKVTCGWDTTFVVTDKGLVLQTGDMGARLHTYPDVKPTTKFKFVKDIPIFVVEIFVKYASCFALGREGVVYAWGDNDHGHLGVSSDLPYVTPCKVNFPVGVYIQQIVPVGSFTFFLDTTGHVWSCGKGENNHLLDGNYHYHNVETPQRINLPNDPIIASMTYDNDLICLTHVDRQTF